MPTYCFMGINIVIYLCIGCDYSGEQYEDGAVFTPRFNPCMNCTCSNHRVRCGNVRCPSNEELKCSRPIALPGDCCPSFCPSESTACQLPRMRKEK